MPATALSTIRDALPVIPPGVAPPAPAELLEVLAAVPDPGKPRGIRRGCAAILAIAVCAVLAGQSSYAALAEWGGDLPVTVRLRLGLRRRVTSEPTIRRLVLLESLPAARHPNTARL